MSWPTARRGRLPQSQQLHAAPASQPSLLGGTKPRQTRLLQKSVGQEETQSLLRPPARASTISGRMDAPVATAARGTKRGQQSSQVAFKGKAPAPAGRSPEARRRPNREASVPRTTSSLDATPPKRRRVDEGDASNWSADARQPRGEQVVDSAEEVHRCLKRSLDAALTELCGPILSEFESSARGQEQRENEESDSLTPSDILTQVSGLAGVRAFVDEQLASDLKERTRACKKLLDAISGSSSAASRCSASQAGVKGGYSAQAKAAALPDSRAGSGTAASRAAPAAPKATAAKSAPVPPKSAPVAAAGATGVAKGKAAAKATAKAAAKASAGGGASSTLGKKALAPFRSDSRPARTR
eukprot:TRINITY_DN41094_c0_g1_i1.p1 TRINITY_DN41094_c0_g1~~TRINITY_DN41094_c0_g1_i1.p1  ORF type:complete len:383 (-),score=63.68 TRINITY_DN41094_c0_g1_i1:127-1197(-)